LHIQDGSFTVLVGPSGCGKSTTLRMVAGFERPSEGEIWIGDQMVNHLAPGKRDISMVFQNYALYPTMTVRGNIEFGLENIRIPKRKRKEMVEEIAEVVGLTEYLDMKPQHLSGGQRQRVALARAMVKKPEVFILDEPLSNLDAKLRGQMRTELIQLHKRLGTTFIYVTHDQVEAMSMADEIVILNKGKIMQQAAPMVLYNDPKNTFVAEFIGTPAMNVLPVEGVRADLGIENNREITHFAFRPEHGKLVYSEDPQVFTLRYPSKMITRETLGSETIYLIENKLGRQHIKSTEPPFPEDADLVLCIPVEKIYYFDEKGNRVEKDNGAFSYALQNQEKDGVKI
ncbi:MAG TPA: ABC transporter ATP-binding protein, partial [Chondromyces sp.]|nr:ABC transporter ATP-binding protein [Chondromyces sp.]